MSQSSIKVENLSKLYRLGNVGRGTIKDDLSRFWHKMRGKEDPFLKIGQINDRTNKQSMDFVWALQNINFEVNEGEVVGIIGRNGAGKSTLLKIITKITSPTTGKINIKGRIASLLEVGTGFHPELTGRENVFMNGAILGMRKWEIEKKFDEIVDFAGVAAYIDTPVKRYSSGMIVRLGFSVAAHLEPEILIVDEVLAVGDMEFQKKCLNRMKSISKNDGRTIVFVSHNMSAIRTLCSSAILLNKGGVEYIGDTAKCIGLYLGEENQEHANFKHFNLLSKDNSFCLSQISIKGKLSDLTEPLIEDEGIDLIADFEIKDDNPDRFHITYHLNNQVGEALFSFTHAQSVKLANGKNRLVCHFPDHFFQSGNYSVSLFVIKDKQRPIFVEKELFSFTIVDRSREIGTYMGREPGYIRPKFSWNNETTM